MTTWAVWQMVRCSCCNTHVAVVVDSPPACPVLNGSFKRKFISQLA